MQWEGSVKWEGSEQTMGRVGDGNGGEELGSAVTRPFPLC